MLPSSVWGCQPAETCFTLWTMTQNEPPQVFPGGPVGRRHAVSAGSSGLTPGQGARPTCCNWTKRKIEHASTKTWWSQTTATTARNEPSSPDWSIPKLSSRTCLPSAQANVILSQTTGRQQEWSCQEVRSRGRDQGKKRGAMPGWRCEQHRCRSVDGAPSTQSHTWWV